MSHKYAKGGWEKVASRIIGHLTWTNFIQITNTD